MSNTILEIVKVRPDLIEAIQPSFSELEETDHADGKYRLRKYSKVRVTHLNGGNPFTINDCQVGEFTQSEKYNKHQGGMARSFEEIEEEVLQSEGMKKICLTFKQANNLIDGQEIEIHQMRVATLSDGSAQTSPEGTHQDGFDYIAMVGVDRQNMLGGELMVYEDRDAQPFLTYALKSGEMVMLNDRKLWHNATPVQAMNRVGQGFGDWFVLCARTS